MERVEWRGWMYSRCPQVNVVGERAHGDASQYYGYLASQTALPDWITRYLAGPSKPAAEGAEGAERASEGVWVELASWQPGGAE